MTNVHEIVEKLRSAKQRLPPNEAAVLFAAAVRLAAAQGATLRARLLQIDEAGGLHLAPFEDQAPETEPGYLAPELHGADAPRKSEPRVQVYAAGALGYELLTGHVPPGNLAELSGPLGDIVRMAVAADRRERFGDLTQLLDALEGVHPRPPAEGERNIFSRIRTRWLRQPQPLEKEAVARLIEKLGALETQVAALTKAQARVETLQSKLDSKQRQTQEQLDRFEEGQQRLQRPAPSVIGPALLAGVLAAAAVVAAGWALGMVAAPKLLSQPGGVTPPAPVPDASERDTDAAPPRKPAAADAKPLPPTPPPSDAKPQAAEPKAIATEPRPAAAETAQPMAAAPEPAAADAGTAAETPPDAGELGAAPVADAGVAAAPAPAPSKRRRGPEVTQAALTHAVAISQVRRGEAALEKGNADEALSSFRAALDNESGLAVAWRGLGMAYAMQSNDAQALKAYQRYLQLAPNASDRADIRRSIAELKARAKIGAGEK